MVNYSFFVIIIAILIIIILKKFSNIAQLLWCIFVNSIIGTAIMYGINIIGENLKFHIGINWITICFSGIFGIPGLVLTIILKVFM